MIGALVRKELRDLRPWAVLAVFVGLADSMDLLAKQVDMQPLAVRFNDLSATAVVWFMGFAIGTGLTTKERDDGTLAFLDGLPITRSAVFIIKTAAVIAVVSLVPLVDLGGAVAFHLISRGSLDHALRAPILFTLLATQTFLCCNAVCIGAAIGRVRSLTWLLAGVGATGLTLLVEHVPRARLLNPLSLLDVEPLATSLVIPPDALVAQAGLTLVAALVAWHGFVSTGSSELPRLAERPFFGTALKLITTIALAVPLLLWGRNLAERDDDEDALDEGPSGARDEKTREVPRFAPPSLAQMQTRHYHFFYPATRAEAARRLATEADAVFARVHALLGTELGPAIDVDLSGSMRNTEGTAYFGRIRIDLGDDATAVLAHESSHVVCQRIAGSDRNVLWNRAHVLDEGLATWVERHFTPNPDEVATDALVLAALHARRELLAEEFFDATLLAARRDESLQYPIGAGLADAVVRIHGRAALPRMVRAFRDPALPSDLSGHALWQAAFQLAGFDLGAVLDDFFRQVSEDAVRMRAAIAALPRPRVRLVQKDGDIGVQPLLDAQAGHSDETDGVSLRLRIKPAPDSPLDRVDSYRAREGEVIWRDADDIAASQLCVQVGIALGKRSLYEPWTCLPVRDAVAWESD